MNENTSQVESDFEQEPIKDPRDSAQSSGEKKKKKRSRIIWLIIFILVNGGVIAYTAIKEFSGEKPDALGYTFGFRNIMFLIAGICCMLTALAIETIKYALMMKNLGVKVRLKTAFETAALGKYYDSVTPSGAGGQPFQIYNMYKDGYSAGESAAMPLASFFTMQVGFVILAILAFVFKNGAIDNVAMKITSYIGAFCYMIVPGFIILFAISHKAALAVVGTVVKLGGKLRIVKDTEAQMASIEKTLLDYHRSITMIRTKKGLLLKLLGLSIIYQLAISSIPFFVIMAYNGNVNYIDMVAMTLFIYCAITIIPTPGNSGAAEGSFYLVFQNIGQGAGIFWAMLVWRVICYYGFIVVGIIIYGYNAVLKYIRNKRARENLGRFRKEQTESKNGES